MNKLRKYVTPLILVFALFALNGSELLHHHDHGTVSDDTKCQACIFNKTVNSSLAASKGFNLQTEISFQPYLLKEIILLVNNYYSSSPGRAPPSAFHV